MERETTLDEDFPALTLEPLELPDGQWVVGNYDKPLTEAEARRVVVIGYRLLRELIARQYR
jgi:hypothetical protein